MISSQIRFIYKYSLINRAKQEMDSGKTIFYQGDSKTFLLSENYFIKLGAYVSVTADLL